MNFTKEITFYHSIAPRITNYVTNTKNQNHLATEKQVLGDFATEIDVHVENMIVAYIREYFPEDAILAEEGHSDTKLTDRRTWVIDPICGTANLARNIAGYCSNIALVQGDNILASCVVDLAQGTYYWSVQGESVYQEQELYKLGPKYPGLLIDVDFGSLYKQDEAAKQRYLKRLQGLLTTSGCALGSINSSLSLLYTALGKIDGYVLTFTNPWDACAGAFLAQQMQRSISAMDGSPWTPSTNNMLVGRDPEVLALLQSV